ncbi:hypothetical protein QOZ80_1AG0016570 [Eleusine coracana subsp. coracana]|nr:hypothetical protein QOZ80_1AG0016570 [Eleusine coracana subsp. coracana]
MAVSSSASCSSVSRTLEEERRHSPISYRVGPLEYHPAINCHYGQKAAMWIFWSDDNPGRRYVKCYRAREGGCDMYEWQKVNMREALAESALKLQRKEEEVDELKRALVAAEAEKDELHARVKKQGIRKLMMRVFVAFLVVFPGMKWLA